MTIDCRDLVDLVSNPKRRDLVLSQSRRFSPPLALLVTADQRRTIGGYLDGIPVVLDGEKPIYLPVDPVDTPSSVEPVPFEPDADLTEWIDRRISTANEATIVAVLADERVRRVIREVLAEVAEEKQSSAHGPAVSASPG